MRINFDKIAPWQIWFALLMITAAVFGMGINNYFVSDDWHWLWLSQEINWSFDIFATNYEGGSVGGGYNPVTFILFKFWSSFFGLRPWPYHIVSLLVHSTSGLLVCLIARKILVYANLKKVGLWSLLAGLLFILWPTQTEVINWLAAWPHLWGVLFYAATFYFYLAWRDSGKISYFWWSLLSFILALWTKEIAISLPFIIILWEIYFYSSGRKTKNKVNIFYYLIILILFLLARYISTQVVFGYYGNSNLGWPIKEWIGNLAILVGDLFTFSYFREIFYKIWYRSLDSVIIIFFAALAWYWWYGFIKKKWLEFVLSVSTLLSLILVMVLGLHRTTFAGERYVYLASIFFILWIIIEVNNYVKTRNLKIVLFIFLLLVTLPTLAYKNFVWQRAGKVAEEIVSSYSEITLPKDKKIASVGLPDNLNGAEVFRNNLQQALELNYSDYKSQILPLPVYTILTMENYQDNLLSWRADQQGLFADSPDRSFVVTGRTSLTMDSIYWELWNYNYENYTANTIRLLPQSMENIVWLTFDKGKLKIVE